MIEAAILGQVTSETIELRTSQSGKKWAACSIGIGEAESREYVRVSIFDDLAERLSTELKKGDKVYSEGRLQLSRWLKDGAEKTSLQIAAWKCMKVGASAIGKNRARKSKAPHQNDERGSNGQGKEVARDWQRPLDDQIPF
jgi:single-stranded DNA-binding protein